MLADGEVSLELLSEPLLAAAARRLPFKRLLAEVELVRGSVGPSASLSAEMSTRLAEAVPLAQRQFGPTSRL